MFIVEPIVATISDGDADGGGDGGGISPPTGQGYDFAVNNLFFKVSPNDNRPYQRATAQFRKDQFDTSQDVGDQSLTGWWMRAQLSFHQGAGVKYYEVSQGDTIDSRYFDSYGVFPFKSGEVRLQKDAPEVSWAMPADMIQLEILSTLTATFSGTQVAYRNGFTGTMTNVAPAGGGTSRGMTVSSDTGYLISTAGKVESFSGGGGQVQLYDGLTTTPWGIFYAKNRLLVADSDGKWYQLPLTPGAFPTTVTGTDVIFTTSDWYARSTVCDTPGPILVGNRNKIFALTVDSSTGDLPTLTTPIQVGQLPPREYISGMVEHLGFIVIVTSAGVRVGVLSDSGQLTYGPLLVEPETPLADPLSPPYTSLGKQDTRVTCVVDNHIVEIDLARQVGQGLEFSWCHLNDPMDWGTPVAAGVTINLSGGKVFWSDASAWREFDDYAPTGWLQTGLHRFGTLENKRFDTVRVLTGGPSGSVAVSKVDAVGTVTPLYTIDVSQETTAEISLSQVAGAESIGLRFDLSSSDPTETPLLLGYQLKAQPEPKRQRMIRVPFEMKDVERRQPAMAAGHTGSAWERLLALEELEESSSIVNYRDFRTGESGRAYFESVEFTNITPPNKGASGFGGIAFVTLRRL